MLKKKLLSWLLLILTTSTTSAFSITNIEQAKLPYPYNFLLTQPLMTQTLEKYYKRTPIIQTQATDFDPIQNSYARTITMLIDRDKQRNNADEAQKTGETQVIELAFIKMNFSELPKEIIEEIRHTNIPFGKLLEKHQIKVLTKNRVYFTTTCTKEIALFMQCNLNKVLYGRKNTIVRGDNHQWLAQVIEILP